MKPVLTSEQMRQTEKRFFSMGENSIDLMEKAARELVRDIWDAMPEGGKTCVFACGAGGNGGDGYAAARLFAQAGGRAVILQLASPTHPDALVNCEKAQKKVYAVIGPDALDTLPRPDVWADCILGIGLSRPVEGDIEKLIARMNADRELGSKTVSCDIPSGLSADSGEVMGICVNADVTTALSCYKRGHFLGHGMDHCGEVKLHDLGIPASCLPEQYMELIEDADITLPARPRTAHKNTFGHLLVFAGSRGMAGAAVMTAKAALRTGAGLVTVACPESMTDIIQISVPCALCLPLPEKDGAVGDEAAGLLTKALRGKTAVAMGPGLSRNASVRCIELLLNSGLPAVIDADALNIMSEHPELKDLLSTRHALTPHPGEAKRLTGADADSVTYAKELSAGGCAALVKGAASVISGKHLRVSISGCTGMAKGGSGDALTGMTGALLAQGLSPEAALMTASQLHGRAGEIAEKKFGGMSMLPTDLIEMIGEAIPHEDA